MEVGTPIIVAPSDPILNFTCTNGFRCRLHKLSPKLGHLGLPLGLSDERILVGYPLNYERHYLPRFKIVAAKITKHNPVVRKAGLSRGLGHGWATTDCRQKL